MMSHMMKLIGHHIFVLRGYDTESQVLMTSCAHRRLRRRRQGTYDVIN